MSDALMENYARLELSFSTGEGCWLIATDGTRYLDCAAGIAVNTLGHKHPHLVAALKEQVDKLWHVSNLYRIPEQEKLAERLTRLAGLDKAFFCNSGAEATEAAVKIARRAMYFQEKDEQGKQRRHKILCAEGAFHGRTLAMLAATDRPAFREGFGPMPEGFAHFPFGNMNVLRDMLAEDAKDGKPEIAAIMVETVQGEGGAKPVPTDFIKAARNAADEFGCLLIADEVQIGVGRSGHLFSFAESGIKADVVAMAKGLGGGFPIGAVLTTDTVAGAMTPGSHGSTFGGNPLAMTAANAVLDIIEEDGFMESVRSRADYLAAGLDDLAHASGGMFKRRGKGFLQGLVFIDGYSAIDMVSILREQFILSVPASENTLRLLPPLIISRDEIDLVLSSLANGLKMLKKVK